MRRVNRVSTAVLFSFIALFLLPASFKLVAQEVFVCVWRNPERTMNRLFPDAHDYRTVSLAISPQKLQAIEERTGSPVLPGQREQYQYFEMLNRSGEVIGYTEAVTQRGEFGAVEFVFGLSKDLSIVSIYIQRARERDRSFRSDEFLDSFIGLNISEAEELTNPLGEGASIASNAIVEGIKKALVTFDELVLNP